ncbi:MAG: DUF2090 domain-containing protein [Patescibacteria group bacterium]
MPLGYPKPLYILPFDHRTSFAKDLLGISGEIGGKDKGEMSALKQVIYEAFERALKFGVPKDSAAILVDGEYGESILRDANEKGYITCLTAEKSGTDEFQFEHEDFGAHINSVKPVFVKALVRYNPRGNASNNSYSLSRLKELSRFAHENGYKFLIEPIVPPIESDVENAGGRDMYDAKMRPLLIARLIKEFQDAGVEPDVWKIEGMEKAPDYENAVSQARTGEREDVGVIILGRGEDESRVASWIEAGRGVKGIIGFAVGRTVFLKPLLDFKKGEISREETIDKIALNYKRFYELFNKRS